MLSWVQYTQLWNGCPWSTRWCPSLPSSSTITESCGPVPDHCPSSHHQEAHSAFLSRSEGTCSCASSSEWLQQASSQERLATSFSPNQPHGSHWLRASAGTQHWFNHRHTGTARHSFHSEASYLITIYVSSSITINPDVTTASPPPLRSFHPVHKPTDIVPGTELAFSKCSWHWIV